MKTLLFKLNKVINTGEDFHRSIVENHPIVLEVIEEISFNMKINLHDKQPPGILYFTYLNPNAIKDL